MPKDIRDAELLSSGVGCYTATEAASDVSALRIPRPTFRRVLGEFPEAALKVRALAAARAGKLFGALERVRVNEFGG